MRELLDYIMKEITGGSLYFIKEDSEGDRTNFIIITPKDIIGLIIGKGGKTIKAIRNLVRVRATLEKKGVSVSVEEKA